MCPGGLILLVGALDEGAAHREYHPGAVVGRLEIADVEEPLGHRAGHVARRTAR